MLFVSNETTYTICKNYAPVVLPVPGVCYSSFSLYFYDLDRRQTEAQSRLRDAAFREKAQLDASTLAILNEIAQDEGEISIRDLEAICIGNGGLDLDITDPSPNLLIRLKASIPKVYPHSHCSALTAQHRVMVYTSSRLSWLSNNRVEIMTRKTLSARPQRGQSEIYFLSFLNDHWIITNHGPGPPE